MDMEQWARVRRKVLIERRSKRSVMEEEGLHWETLQKMLAHSRPPGYRRVNKVVRQIDAHREWVAELKAVKREVFVPLIHRPGEAQVDFGHALVNVNGVLRKRPLFVMSLPYSDGFFMAVFEWENTAFGERHVQPSSPSVRRLRLRDVCACSLFHLL